ncbi:MAG TPA: AAA family ATPase [Thermoleophilaceae bacterium]|nr:AAA family ATPase [Thermoleophilaceae bacterium]
MGSAIRIHLRGELRLEVDGSRLENRLPGRLGRALLAYLVLNRHRPATRDELVHALWPTNTPRDPAATLSTLLSSLRRALGPELVKGRSELQLELPADAEVDVDEAASSLAAARAALDSDLELACSSAQAATDIYERPLVPTFDAPWIEEHRREQEEWRLEALELLAEASLALGGGGPLRAQLAARQLVELAPFRESGHALLIRAHAARGNQAEALQAFERVRVLLREELGSTPSAQLRALHEQVLAATGEAAPDRLPLPPTLAKIDGRTFVGRESALAQLHEALAAARRRGRRFVLTAGEPGIGKTSLAATFAREAHDGGAIVLYGRCDEEALVPYQPFVDVISHLVLNGQVDQLGESLRFELEELGRLVPELRRQMPAMRAPSGGLPETERYRLFEAVVTTLARVAGDRTLVLVFDDLHWADRPTLLLLRHLARAVEPRRLVVVGAYRDVEVQADSALAEVIADVRRESSLELLTLNGLDEQETGALIEAHQGSAAAPGLAQRLHELTGGNPFFLEESIRAAADPSGVPPGVREVVLRRVSRLGPQAGEVLGLAAVMGVSFPMAALAPAGGFVRENVGEILDRAVSARLLTGIDGRGRLSFSHELIRQALHDELGTVVRAHLHELVAQTLEKHRAELRPHPAELSHHFYEARHSLGAQPALRYAREAADSAADSLAWEEAALHLERALELEGLPDAGDRDERCELLLQLAEMRLRAGHPGFSDAFAEAADAARGRSSTQLARAAIGYAGRYYEAGVVDTKLIDLLRDALAVIGDDEQDLRARLLARLAEILQFAGDEEASLGLAREAVQIAHDLADDHVLVDALAGSHVSMLHIRHLPERLIVSDELIRISRQIGDRERTLQGLHARIFDLIQTGEIRAAREALDELSSIAAEVRQPLFEHFAVGWSATFAQMDGRLEDAERLAAESAEMRRLMETADAEAVFAAQLFLIRLGQGRVGELLPAVEQFVDAYPALAAWRAALPLAYLADRREADSARELERAVAGLDELPQDFFWLATIGLLAEAAGKLPHPESAAVLYEKLEPYASCVVQVGYAGSIGPVARLLGLLAAARGERDTAVRHLEHALRFAEGAGLRLFETQARVELDELLTASA